MDPGGRCHCGENGPALTCCTFIVKPGHVSAEATGDRGMCEPGHGPQAPSCRGKEETPSSCQECELWIYCFT